MGLGSLTQNITAAPGALVTHRKAKELIAKMKAYPSPLDGKKFGLTMWFDVTVAEGNGLKTKLGEWSGCSGLGVVLKPDEFRAGGRYVGIERLAGEVSYPQVTLERGVEVRSAASVQEWLKTVVEGWENANSKKNGGGEAKAGNDIEIKLWSAYRETEICSWTLRNAIPVQWTGPTLNARGSDIGIEKLVLAHDGFLPTKETKDGKLTLSKWNKDSKKLDGDPLVFPYNPVSFTTAKIVDVQTKNNLTVATDDQIVNRGNRSYTLPALRVDGVESVNKYVRTLFDWISPNQTQKKDNSNSDAQILQLSMGTDGEIKYKVILLKVSAKYTRFTPSGDPCRVEIDLTLEEFKPPAENQNPTSGTLEDGKVHQVIAGDSLPSIATEAYGDASAWRRVADENGIDDPLRLRNGRSLLLSDAS